MGAEQGELTKIVDDYWCYIQPVAEAVRAEVLKRSATPRSQPAWSGRSCSGVVQFIEAYRANEGKEPTMTQLAAVSAELEDSAERAMAGEKVMDKYDQITTADEKGTTRSFGA